MADISKIAILNGSEYNLKDAAARSALTDKVDKITGKGLSTNDFTDEYKEKVDSIGNYVYVENTTMVYASTSVARVVNTTLIVG